MSERSLRRGAEPRQNLHRQVVDDLGLQVVSGAVKPGHVFPTEAELGTKLGVSRSAMREAIKVLAAKGLVESRQKLGTVVRPRADWNMLDPDVLAWWGTVGPLKEFSRTVYEMRRIIEPEAAALAASRGSKEAVVRIGEAYEAMAASLGNLERTIKPDLEFHMAIVDAAGNALLRSLGALIESALVANFKITSAMPHALRNSLPLHRAVFDRIAASDPAGARTAMIVLIDDAIALTEGAGKTGC